MLVGVVVEDDDVARRDEATTVSSGGGWLQQPATTNLAENIFQWLLLWKRKGAVAPHQGWGSLWQNVEVRLWYL